MLETADVKVLAQDVRQRLKCAGLQFTRQRGKVLEVLAGSKTHLDAYDIYLQVAGSADSMSLSTVYRVLQAFKDAGLVSENHLGEDHHHYEIAPEPSYRHFHAVCDVCGSIIEFSFATQSLVESNPAFKGFQVVSVDLSIRGICAECEVKGKDQDE